MKPTFLRALHDLAAASASTASLDEVFRRAAHAADTGAGHDLCTVMIFHASSREVERAYSSLPRHYPSGGRKQKGRSLWSEQVLERGEPFLGADADAIRANFDDHETILGLGLRSVVNLPIRLGGETLGTLNLLSRDHHYGASDIVAASVVAGLLAGPLARLGRVDAGARA